MVTWRSCITSNNADWTLAGARLISSASRKLQDTGPSSVSNPPWSGRQIRVPIRSEGTRSGVNWIRWKLPPRTWARVAMVRVLASPGTPSNSRCPPDNNATRTRSSMPSWPTITRLISNNAASRAADGLAGSATLRRRWSFSVIWAPCGNASRGRSGETGAAAGPERARGGQQEQAGGAERPRHLPLLHAEADARPEAVVHRGEVLAARRLEEAAVAGLGDPGQAVRVGRDGLDAGAAEGVGLAQHPVGRAQGDRVHGDSELAGPLGLDERVASGRVGAVREQQGHRRRHGGPGGVWGGGGRPGRGSRRAGVRGGRRPGPAGHLPARPPAH